MSKHKRPVCVWYEFESEGSFAICKGCGWQDDPIQEENPDERECANQMSLNEAREAYKICTETFLKDV